jgi:hypothetical protein
MVELKKSEKKKLGGMVSIVGRGRYFYCGRFFIKIKGLNFWSLCQCISFLTRKRNLLLTHAEPLNSDPLTGFTVTVTYHPKRQEQEVKFKNEIQKGKGLNV